MTTAIARVRTIRATSPFIAATIIVAPAFAAGSNMPWEQPLQQILQSIEGPVSKMDTAGGFRRLIQIVFGLSIAFAASSFFLSFFSFGGGALI
jgi:type IV secretory pathway VirB2 component (pilin)